MTTAYLFKQGGLTLIEALAALAVLSVIMGIAAPQMHSVHMRWQISQTAHAMASTLMLARSQALRQGGGIQLEKLSDCPHASDNKNWSCGWLLYAGTNASTRHLLQEVKLSGKVNVMRTAGGVAINFDRYGMADGLNTKSFRFSPSDAASQVGLTHSLCMGSGGRIRVIPQAQCS